MKNNSTNRWEWVAVYSDYSEFRQFDGSTGKSHHQFSEIDFDRLRNVILTNGALSLTIGVFNCDQVEYIPTYSDIHHSIAYTCISIKRNHETIIIGVSETNEIKILEGNPKALDIHIELK